MGIELDVIVGHPEHDLLFVATQVARAAGLKNPAGNASDFAKVMRKQNQGITLLDVASQILDYRVCRLSVDLL